MKTEQIEVAIYSNLARKDHKIICPNISWGLGRTIFNGVVVVLVRNVDTGVICHECFHAVEFHFAKIGMPHGNKSSEAWAYYLQFLVQEITSRITLK